MGLREEALYYDLSLSIPDSTVVFSIPTEKHKYIADLLGDAHLQ